MKRQLFDSIQVIPAPLPTGTAAGEVAAFDLYDRQGFLSAVLGISIGDITGTPEDAKLSIKLMHADEADGAFSELDDKLAYMSGKDFPLMANGKYILNLDIIGCKRYVKPVVTLWFAGGDTPNADITGSALIFGDANEQPV